MSMAWQNKLAGVLAIPIAIGLLHVAWSILCAIAGVERGY